MCINLFFLSFRETESHLVVIVAIAIHHDPPATQFPDPLFT